MKIVFLFCFLFSLAFANQEDTAGQKSDREIILAQYSLEQLRAVANLLNIKIENPKLKILKCDPTMVKTKMWLSGPLRSLMDLKQQVEIQKYKADPALFSERIKTCVSTCQCSTYYGILESADEGLSLSEIHKATFQNLKANIKLQTRKQELSCSKKQTWFCKSPLYKYLNSVK